MGGHVIIIKEADVARWLINRLAELGQTYDYQLVTHVEKANEYQCQFIHKFIFDEDTDMDKLADIL